MTDWGADIDAILNSGFDLASFGVQGWALPRPDALSAVGRLQSLGVGEVMFVVCLGRFSEKQWPITGCG